MSSAWRPLLGFWVLVLAAAATGAGVLAYLGPPPRPTAPLLPVAPPPIAAAPKTAQPAESPPSAATAAQAATTKAAPAPATQPQATQTQATPAPAAPTQAAPPAAPAPSPSNPAAVATLALGAPIRAPDPALLEPLPSDVKVSLPRIGPQGRRPMDVYAGGYDPADPRPKIGILLAGIGQSSADSEEAGRSLPAAVSFAVSPYTPKPDALLPILRAGGHEFLVEIPMEPQGYPVNDEGNEELLSGAPAAQNGDRLDWTLSRFAGYVGATNALDGLRGERFTATTGAFRPVLDDLASRGLLFLDAAPNSDRIAFADVPKLVAGREDVVLDEPAVRPEIEKRLAELETFARSKGAAIGIALLPRPITVSAIAAWAGTLESRGFTLVPVSAILRNLPPAPHPDTTKADATK